MTLKAFIIGIGKRAQDDECMKYTENDAIELKKNLIQHCNTPEDNITLVAGKDATRTNILEKFESFEQEIQNSEKPDCVILFYSGHAKKTENGNQIIYTLPCQDSKGSSQLKADTFFERAVNLKAKSVLLVFDCCYASGINIPLNKGNQKEFLETKENRVILASSRKNEKSIAANPVSLFTLALINGLVGDSVTDEPRRVKILDLALYVREHVISISKRSRGNTQTPTLDVAQGSLMENFVITTPTLDIKSRHDLPFRTISECGTNKAISYAKSTEYDEEFRSKIEELKRTITINNSEVALIAPGATINIHESDTLINSSPRKNTPFLNFSFRSMNLMEFVHFSQEFHKLPNKANVFFSTIFHRENYLEAFESGETIIIACINKTFDPFITAQIKSILQEYPEREKILYLSKKVNNKNKLQNQLGDIAIIDSGTLILRLDRFYKKTGNQKTKNLLNYAYQIGIQNYNATYLGGSGEELADAEILLSENLNKVDAIDNFLSIDDNPKTLKKILASVSSPRLGLSINDISFLKAELQKKPRVPFYSQILNIYLSRILNEKIDIDDIKKLNTDINNSAFDDNTLREKTNRSVLFSIVNHICNIKPLIAQSNEFTLLLKHLLNIDSSYWYPRAINIFFNLKLNNQKFSKKINDLLEEYLTLNSNPFYKRMLQYVTLPYSIAERFKRKDSLLSEIKENIKNSTDTFQCIWYLKIFNHYAFFSHTTDDAPSKQLEDRLELMKSIRKGFLNASPKLLFLKMVTTLDLYKRTLEIEILNDFETLFLRSYTRLGTYYRNRLQLSYALTLSKTLSAKRPMSNYCFDLFNSDDWAEQFKEFPLLYNSSLKGCENIFTFEKTKRLPKKSQFQDAINQYIELQFNYNFKPQIENNFMYAFQFRELITLSDFNTEFQNIVFSAYNNFTKTDINLPPSKYCRIFSGLSFINFDRFSTPPIKDLKLALQAPPEVFIRNAMGIFRFIYRMENYYDYDKPNAVSRNEIKKLTQEAVEKVNIPLSKGMYFWIYIHALNLKFDSPDFEFLKKIYHSFKGRKFFYFRDPKGFAMPISTIKNISDNDSKISPLARTCSNFLNLSEMWNFFATMIMDKAPLGTTEPINDMAARFYSVGLYLAKDNFFYDQKYSFNYIHAASKSMILNDLFDKKFIFDTLHYLSKSENTKFPFSGERSIPFFILLNNHAGKFNREDIEYIDRVVRRSERYNLRGEKIWLRDQIKGQEKICERLRGLYDENNL
jgi:hypothetical protein